MCTFLLPKTVTKQIDKFRKHCLWRGSNLSSKKSSKPAWPLVCVPKPGGGLGVINLIVQNESLLLNHLHKFYNKVDIPWVQLVWGHYYSQGKLPYQGRRIRGFFWWRDILKLQDDYKGMAMVSVKDGSTCFLWHDLWGGSVCSQTYPELFSYANNQQISLKVAASIPLIKNLFHLRLFGEANAQFQEL